MKYVFSLFFLLILFIPASYAGTWLDNFENTKMDAWELINATEEHVSYWSNNGVFTVQSSPKQVFPAGWIAGEEEHKNYELTCKFRVVEPLQRFMSVGILFHVDWLKHTLYVVELVPAWKVAVLVKVVEGRSRVLAQLNYEYKMGTWDTFTASIDPKGRIHFRMGLGNNRIFRDVDPLLQGKFGVTVTDAKVEFDDVMAVGDNIEDGGPALLVNSQRTLSVLWGSLKTYE